MTLDKNRDSSPDQKVVAAFHKKDDLNTSNDAHHHSIGKGIYQVASGKHNHINDGEPIFDGSVDIISGSRGSATASVLGQVIDLLVKLGATDTTTP